MSKKEMLNYAEQQILGYYSAKSGETLKDFIRAMGLTSEEYYEMIEGNMLDYLPQEFLDEIFDATLIG